jgi:hypothetical protein
MNLRRTSKKDAEPGGPAKAAPSGHASNASLLLKKVQTEAAHDPPHPADLARIQAEYGLLDREEKPVFFQGLVENLETDRERMDQSWADLQAAREDPVAWRRALSRLRADMESPRARFFGEFIALPGGLKFLLDLRADVLAAGQKTPDLDLGPLDEDLVRLFEAWFGGGFLFLQEISLNSPYRQIEIIKDRDLVHPMTRLEEMGRRLGRDRRCFALYHRLMPEEPVVFIEVALTRGIAQTIQEILGPAAAQSPPEVEPDTAVFYSINNTQNGLAGLGLGKTLIFQVVDYLKRDTPTIRNFCTLSPLPGFWRRYLKPLLEGSAEGFKMTPGSVEKLFDRKIRTRLRQRYESSGGTADAAFPDVLLSVFSNPAWAEDKDLVAGLERPLEALGFTYLAEEKGKKGGPLDPVANFHLGNGASVSPQNVHFGANWSAMGLERSLSLMVNYVYSADWRNQIKGSMAWLSRLLPGLARRRSDTGNARG